MYLEHRHIAKTYDYSIRRFEGCPTVRLSVQLAYSPVVILLVFLREKYENFIMIRFNSNSHMLKTFILKQLLRRNLGTRTSGLAARASAARSPPLFWHLSRAITASIPVRFLKATLFWTRLTETFQLPYSLFGLGISEYPVIFYIEIYRENQVSGSITRHYVSLSWLIRLQLTQTID
jgi:hypothetical protein